MTNQRIFLIGMPGAGKSTVGRALARRLGLTYVDADAELVKRCGVSVATIFELEGEAGFREREAQLLTELVKLPNIILATGGGVILREDNRVLMRACGTVIYLLADIADLIKRTRRDNKRPLLQGGDAESKLAALFETRKALYRATAHLTIESTRSSVSSVIGEAIAALSARSQPDPSPMPHNSAMTSPTILHVTLAYHRYPIVIGADLLSDVSPIVACLPQPRVVIVTNVTIWPLYGAALVATLTAAGVKVIPIILPDGEMYKDFVQLNTIFDTLLEHACDRKTTIIALGGGVIGDMAGFAAATYQRGVPFIQIPTTLLAQVDSSVGGKTAVNHPRGKNMIGAFYQPQLVLADTNTLRTLSDRELRSGLAEVIKYGLILDAKFFDWLESNLDALLARDAHALTHAITRSCELKAEVVAADERETAKEGGRALLNLGHTFGHAIETAMGYGVWLHGEAVATGMVLAAQFSVVLGKLSVADAKRAEALLLRAGLPVVMPQVSTETMLEHMARDKKNEGGVIKLILLNRIGEAVADGGILVGALTQFLESSPRKRALT